VLAFLERTDYAMRSSKLTIKKKILILPILLAASLFFLRTVLGATALFAFATAFDAIDQKNGKKGKPPGIDFLGLVGYGLFLGRPVGY